MQFEEKNFNNITYQNQQIIEHNLQDKEFTGCTFKKCNFSGSDFSGSSFIDCIINDSNLSNIKIENCNFQGVKFIGCKLVGVSFSVIKTFLIDWSFQNCLIYLCDFNKLSLPKSKFIDCELHENDFINANLCAADFTGSDLWNSKFFDTNLEKADFRTARNYYLNPINNKLTGAMFTTPEVLNLLHSFNIKIEM
ncbi:MAG: pentapeptide repeat-containing protein [bacterium]